MKQVTFHLIHAYNVKPNINIEASAYCQDNMAYFMAEKDSFVQLARDMYQVEKEKAEWIRKYDHLLKGVRYWQAKCKELENETKNND